MSKYLFKYFLRTGIALGLFPHSFDETNFKAGKSKALGIYSFCFSSVLLFLFPTSYTVYFLNFLSGKLIDKYTLMGLVSTFEMIMQIITYILIVWNLVYKNGDKILSTFNCGADLMQVLPLKYSKALFNLIILKIICFDWISNIFYYLSNEQIWTFGLLNTWPMAVTLVGSFIIDFIANIFFCSLYCAGKFYKGLNKDLKTIIYPLHKRSLLTHSEILEISDKIDQKMVLHAKVGKLVENFNQIFSMICASLILTSFTTIVGEFYCFYAFSRISLENNQEMVQFNVYMAFYKLIETFSFVYASNHITEQFENTGDILKVFLDASVDDRLKNSVSL